MGPVGKVRSPLVVLLLSIVTLGIYGIVWQYLLFKEMKDHSNQGVGGAIGLILAIFTPVNPFLLPHEVGGLYTSAGREAPVRWTTGFWVLLPLVGAFVWLWKVQGRLNDYWQSVGAAPAGAATF